MIKVIHKTSEIPTDAFCRDILGLTPPVLEYILIDLEILEILIITFNKKDIDVMFLWKTFLK